MGYSINTIANMLSLQLKEHRELNIAYLVTDSRKIVFPAETLFFAIKGPRRNGIDFIISAYAKGVRCFVVDEPVDEKDFLDACFLVVPNALAALQQIASYHRKQFDFPVIGITGSNGKTIVKEWLYQMLSHQYNIVRSPRSYNSQIGVPLSVWQMNASHTLGIFEAGISTIGEMANLEKIIQPTIGVLTSIGEAHSEGFESKEQKLQEKSLLFKHASTIVDSREIRILNQEKGAGTTKVHFQYKDWELTLTIPFTDSISIQNALTCSAVLLFLGYEETAIQDSVLLLEPVEMRMQLRKGINHCFVLNDSYSNDIVSLELALNFLQEQAGDQPKTVILSDIVQSNQENNSLYQSVINLLIKTGVKKCYFIGASFTDYLDRSSANQFPFEYTTFLSTEQFIHSMNHHSFQQEFILLKGARVFEFEQIAHWLEQQVHQTVLEINLTAMVQNLKTYQSLLRPKTKLMAMVKAFSYGSGAGEVARRLQQQQVDYLAVAYADEGVELRKAGISLPIMVMSPDENTFDSLINYNLEPEIFSVELFAAFYQYIQKEGLKQFPIHLKLNTGMNRLGFDLIELPALLNQLSGQDQLIVQSVMSHLVASEDPVQDAFTADQVEQFNTACETIENALGYSVIKHIANTAAIIRNPSYQLDMVRLGIGLYGVDSASSNQLNLQTVASLKSTVAQVRKVKAGDTVGYGRKGMIERESIIATIRIGYADGYSRKLSNGVGNVFVRGLLAPIVGNICMDMCMIDVTDIAGVAAGDVVEIFGNHISVQTLAKQAGTIPYEIMTSISQRVKRVYFEE
ncbi:MAG: alanine racemase [Sphingobacteriia bacterium]|jgi:alanine racemase